MSGQISPFAALTGAEKQIKWLEYQSVRLPYIQTTVEEEPVVPVEKPKPETGDLKPTNAQNSALSPARPLPPPEIPRSMQQTDFQKTRHSQYDAVIARMKQAELQARGYQSMS